MGYYRRNSPWILTVFFFVILIWGSYKYVFFKRGQWETDVRNNALEVLIGKKSSLEKSLYSRIYYTRGVAAFVSLKPNINDEEYARLASEFIQDDSVISTMALSRNCILNSIYPLDGHEEAIGLNLMQHPERREIVEKTIATRKTFVAGPVELVEGGVAFISYTPIFDTTVDTSGVFWGMTDIVIYKDRLFEEAGLLVSEHGFNFALRGEDGTGENGKVFWGSKDVFDDNPVVIRIELPTGYWQLASTPVIGWSAYYNQDRILSIVLFLSSFIISVLLFFILHGIHKLKIREQELRAIFRSMDTLIVEYNRNGDYLKIAPTNLDLLILPTKDLVGKNISQIFSPEIADLFLKSINKCLKTKKVIVIDYPLDIRGEKRWFTARISYKSAEEVVFNVYDVTKLKQAEAELRFSERSLKELNNLKDTFFSIIAHDLRNPIASFRNLTDLILSDEFEQTEQEKMVLIRSINDTSIGLGDLLENLLSWAQSQQKAIKVLAKQQQILPVIESVVESQKSHALLKNISIQIKVDAVIMAVFDSEITRVVLRNLISNALKYSHKDSSIIIDAKIDNDFLHVSIEDEGMGIPPEKLQKLFKFDKEKISAGTKNEKGSGLGLVLCKEFVELQGGTIWAISNNGKGAILNFTLPL